MICGFERLNIHDKIFQTAGYSHEVSWGRILQIHILNIANDDLDTLGYDH